jgi:uncharacterized Rmd1/YagE family protein
VVFINVSPATQATLLDRIKAHSSKPLPSGFEHDDLYSITVSPTLQSPSIIKSNSIAVKRVDLKNASVISTVMGQSVAIDYYYMIVDEMLETFTRLNSTVENSGKFTKMDKEQLFKVVALNNSVFIGLVARLGLLERSDTSWDYSE